MNTHQTFMRTQSDAYENELNVKRAQREMKATHTKKSHNILVTANKVRKPTIIL